MSWLKFFVDKILFWVFLVGVVVSGVWGSWNMERTERKWKEAGWGKSEGGWIPPGFEVQVVPERLNPDGTAMYPQQPFRSQPYDWNGGVGTPAPSVVDQVRKSASKKP